VQKDIYFFANFIPVYQVLTKAFFRFFSELTFLVIAGSKTPALFVFRALMRGASSRLWRKTCSSRILELAQHLG
jgi:hypothetical protein